MRPLIAVLSAVFWLTSISHALAHATLLSSAPVDGAVIASPPQQFVLTFNEPVSALVLRVIDGSGKTRLLQNPSGRDASLIIPSPGALPEGTHVLSWRVVSLDGHPVGGSVVFSVGAPSKGAVPGTEISTDTATAVALWVSKIVLYLGLFVGVGGSFFRAWLARDSLAGDRVMVATLAAALVAIPAAIVLQGADALGISLWESGHNVVWQTGFETSFGMTAVAAAFALVAALFALRARAENTARSLSLTGILVMGLALALSGHASAAAPQWLMRPTVFVHAISVGFWIGCLVPICSMLRNSEGLSAALARFSRVIPLAIFALVASGAVLAVIQVMQLRFLLKTAYGQLLSAKLILVAILLAIAAWNRFRLTRPVMAGKDRPRHQLRRAIFAEIGIVVIILALVAAWRFTPPPRALAIAEERPARVHIHTATAMVDLTVEPGHAGIVRASIAIMTGDFGGLDAKEVQLTMENKVIGIEPIVRPAKKDSDGLWRVDQLPIPSAGRWDIRVDILINDFEKTILDGEINIAGR
jgi:copper transport protein